MRSKLLFGPKTTRGDVQGAAFDIVEKAVREGVPESEIRNMATSLIEVVGLNPGQVLNDRALFSPSGERQVRITSTIESLEKILKARILPVPQHEKTRGQLEVLREMLVDQEVSLEGYIYRPYTTPFFRSVDQMDEFSETAQWAPFLRRVGIDPADQSAVDQFWIQQENTIVRITP